MVRKAVFLAAATAIPLIMHGGHAMAQTFSVHTVIAVEKEIDDKCRGGPGNEPKTWVYCEIRDSLVNKIKSLGWCYGPKDQPEYKKEWQPCDMSYFGKSLLQ